MKTRLASTLRRGVLCLILSFCHHDSPAAEYFPKPSALPLQTNLPDPLIMRDGRRVTTPDQWFHERKPELKTLFQHYMYGTMPPAPAKPRFTVTGVDKHFLGGKATRKEIAISLADGPDAPALNLLLVVPNAARDKQPPVFVCLNFCGNHTVLADPGIALPTSWMPKSCPGCVDNHATDAGRGAQSTNWAVEATIDRGYAFSTFYYGDVEPDQIDASTGIRAWLHDKQHSSDECGAIAAWAWGVSRAVDYLVTDSDVDGHRIAAVGHSRNGKAACLAGAFDDRIALVIPLQAGCGGTSPSRGTIGESVKRINTSFPHWFNASFKQFNEEPARLPFDQDCLIAMIAPRPVLIGCAQEDTWSNPEGQFEMMVAADPVYHLLGRKGIEEKQMPPLNHLVGGNMGYFIRPGKHSMAASDWKVFLDFADQHLK